jgi:AcrR family transcriptional regulator
MNPFIINRGVPMPKLIPDAKNNILSIAKKQLFMKGYNGLIIREVAEQCGLAVGTIYNYFSSKDMLVASIMAEDWLISLRNMQNSCKVSSTIEQGVKAIYYEIHVYVQLYEKIWSKYKGIPSGFVGRHLLLRTQLSDLLTDLLVRHGRKEDTELCPLLAETILASAMQKDIDYSVLSKVVIRLFH